MDTEANLSSNTFLLGHKELDTDHLQMFGKVQHLSDRIEAQAPASEIIAIVEALARFTQAHFEVEESMMRQIKFVDYILHKNEHERLYLEIQSLCARLTDGRVLASKAVVNYLNAWLLDHILARDQALVTAWQSSQNQAHSLK